MCPAERNEVAPGVVDKVALILAAFDSGETDLGVRQIAARTGLATSTVHRLTSELVTHRVLERGLDARLRLGLRLFELGELVPRHRTLSQAARPIMEDLWAATHQRIHLAVLDGVDVVYVEIVGGTGLPLSSRTGGRLPAHATGVGKVILAYSSDAVIQSVIDSGLRGLTPQTITSPDDLQRALATIRAEGTAYDNEESHRGISCVAAPVFGMNRQIRAGLSITGQTRAIDPFPLGVAVRTAAFTLSRALRRSRL